MNLVEVSLITVLFKALVKVVNVHRLACGYGRAISAAVVFFVLIAAFITADHIIHPDKWCWVIS